MRLPFWEGATNRYKERINPPSLPPPMSSYIPPELVHQIISYLHNDTKSLSACALTARDWLPSTRHHRFRSIRLHSAKQIDSFHQFSRDAPDILPYYQEAIISSGYVDESVLEAAATVCLTLPNLERIKFSNRSCASPPRVLTILSPVANKITALSLSGTFLTSSKDFWPLICSFPNLNTVQASGVTFLSTSETAFELTNAYEPPITTFSISASRQDFVIDHLVNPPFPLRFLKNFEIRTTDTHQTSLVPLAESIQETVERLTFFAISIHGPDDQSGSFISPISITAHLTVNLNRNAGLCGQTNQLECSDHRQSQCSTPRHWSDGIALVDSPDAQKNHRPHP